MKKILIVWELGNGLGHIMNLLSLAKRLKSQGHSLHFLVREGYDNNALLNDLAVPLDPIPSFPHSLESDKPIRNFSDLLLNNGFRDHANIKNRVAFWHKSFNEIQPALIIADHSPSAVLTAYILKIPYVLTGNRFYIPPNIAPYPPSRYWKNVSEAELKELDDELLNSINQVCKHYKVEGMKQAQTLYKESVLQVLQTYPEVDHYPNYISNKYYGLCNDHVDGDDPEWIDNDKPKVLVYLRPEHDKIKQILLELTKLDANFLIRMKIEDNLLLESLDKDRVIVTDQLLDMSAMLEACDVLVCHGNHNITMEALLKGKPILALPGMVEPEIIARRLNDQKLGLIAYPELIDFHPRKQLERLISDKSYTDNAKAFMQKYAKPTVSENIKKISDLISML